jgi:predicted nuclease with TOPRIM domain
MIILTIFLFFAFLYYFTKFNDIRRNQKKIFDRVNFFWIENQKLRVRIKELQSYKTDVSKTFKILDTELNMINDQLRTRQEQTSSFNNNISLLTPEILTNLMENMNQEEIEPIQIIQSESVNASANEIVNESASVNENENASTSVELQLHPFTNDLSRYFINVSQDENKDMIKEVVNELIDNVVQ